MNRNHMPQAEQLRPTERLAQFGNAVLHMFAGAAAVYGVHIPVVRERYDLAIAISQLESHANDPVQHDHEA